MESLLTKRNVIIAGVVVVVIIGALVFLGRRKVPEEASFVERLFPVLSEFLPGAKPAPAAPRPSEEATELPLSTNAAGALRVGTLVRLSQDNISSLSALGTTSVRYHKNIPENLGHLFERRVDRTDEEKRISNFTIPQILRVVWAPDARKAVVFYNLDNQVRKLLIDYGTTTPRTNFLPDSVSDVAFSPDSRSLAFINERSIFVATSDFRNPRKVLDNDIPNFEIGWPAQSLIALKTKSSYAVRGFLYTLNINTGELNKIAEGLGLDVVWSPDGSGAIYSRSTADGNMQNLKFINIQTLSEKEFEVKTIAEKCAFLRTLKNTVYCGVPKNQSGKLPDEWWQGKVGFQDDFISLDTSTGQNSPFVPTPTDVTQPKLLADDSYLLFHDKNTGNLWSLKLKP